jgi:5-formyltetrahydrofolate cyclo-ligase
LPHVNRILADYLLDMDELLDVAKKLARKQAAARRSETHAAVGETAPLALVSRLFPFEATRTRNRISGFFPYKTEIDVRPLLGKLAGEGWTTCLPVVIAANQALVFRRWLPGEPTEPGAWDIPRPLESAPQVEPDLLLVPMMAFDRQGIRLGYGGGFYDRTLQALRRGKKVTAIGVAYSSQIADVVPHGPDDQRMDYIMTEKELFACG